MRFEPTLIHRTLADRLARVVPAHGVGSRDPMHQRGQLRGSNRTHHQMPVVRHDAVAQQRRREAIEAFGQHRDELRIVASALEKRLAAGAAIDHVDTGRRQ
jgi:hypothetical protein